MADGSLPLRIPHALAPEAAGEADVVLFAGGGGSSIAIEQALGKHPDAALNHWDTALLVHQLNFPGAEHHCADVMETDPRIVCPGRPMRLLWLSPDCRHFSPAKGSAPVSKSIRALAWAAIPWAKLRRPRVIVLENVEAFLTWGPVLIGADGRGKPDPAHKGRTFERWVRRLKACGYVVDWRIVSAADFGAPTIRKRLFLVARCDGGPMDFPLPTHAPRKTSVARRLPAHRAAAECIDFSRPCPSIFLSPEEARALRVKRPLEEATLARIAKGLLRYTIAAADPFIVGVTHAGDDRTRDVREPLATVTGANRGEFALVAPTIVGLANRDHVERPGVRTWSVEDPLRVVTGSNNHALCMAHLQRQFGASVGSDCADPVGVVTAGGGGKTGLVAAFMEQANTGMVGHDAREPVSAVMSVGVRQRLVAAQLTHAYTSNTAGGEGDPRKPLKTVMAGGNHAYLLEAALQSDQPMRVPFAAAPPRVDCVICRGTGEDAYGQRCVCTYNKDRELRAFLVKYYGEANACDLVDPLATVTSRSRFGLVMVAGAAFRIVDIGMRMLDPETELAAAMGVPKRYVLGWDAAGRRVTKTKITKMVGNMVSPPPAAALLRALFPEVQGRAA